MQVSLAFGRLAVIITQVARAETFIVIQEKIGPYINGIHAVASGTIDLTALESGTSDWIRYGYPSGALYDYKSGGGQLFSAPLTLVGGGSASNYGLYAVGFSWSDGTNNASETGTVTGEYNLNSPPGKGVGFTVPASVLPRTLTVYCQIPIAGKFTATLGDASAPPYSFVASGGGYYAFTIAYKAATTTTLTIEWLYTGATSNNPTIFAAVLTQP